MIIGIVGKPNCGKSTFFKAATLADILIANYPFATIEPNTGVGYVKLGCVDKEFNTQCNPRHGFCVEHIRFVPVQMIDVAGLVPGAYEGKGMGNQFLDDLRQADVLVHVIDISGSTNDRGEPVAALSHDPCEDVRFLEDELDQWYAGILKKGWDKFARTVSVAGKKLESELSRQLSGLSVTEDHVKEALKLLSLPADARTWTSEHHLLLARELRKMTKPIIIAANKIDVRGAQANLAKVREAFSHLTIIPISAESELALREADKHELISYIPGSSDFTIIGELSEKQRAALSFIKERILSVYESTGVQQVLDTAVFDVLGYCAIFPGSVGKLGDSEGNILPDCFLMPPKSTALDFAFKLHTDFGRNFIKAIDVKRKMPVGKDHALAHRDVIEIHYKK